MLHRIAWNYGVALKSRLLDRRGLEELQRKKIRALTRHVYESVPLYHDSFRERNLRPDDVQTCDQLRLLPILTRQSIESGDRRRMLRSGMRIERTISRHTTGTTGRPLDVVWDSEYCDVTMALRLRNAWFTGMSHLARTLEIQYWGSDDPAPAGRSVRRRVNRILFGPMVPPKLPTLRAKIRGFRGSIVEVEAELMKFRPEVVECRPSYLRRLGVHLRNERRPLEIKKVIPDGEYLSRQAREEIAELFRAEVFDFYGAIELGPLGIECRAHSGKHLNADYFVFEFLKDGEPVGPGEPAEVLVTPLHNTAMPLLRYRIGDVVVPDSDEVCECGIRLPRIKEILGRPSDGLVLPDGTKMPTGAVVDYLEGVVGLREYQLVQTGTESILMKLKEDQNSPQVHALVLDYLKTLFGYETKMSVETWKEDDIPPKYRPVIRRLAV